MNYKAACFLYKRCSLRTGKAALAGGMLEEQSTFPAAIIRADPTVPIRNSLIILSHCVSPCLINR